MTHFEQAEVLHDTGHALGRSTSTRTLLLRDGEHKVRLTAHLDSYDFQAFTEAERWDGNRWQQVVRWSGKQHPLPSPYDKQANALAALATILAAARAVYA